MNASQFVYGELGMSDGDAREAALLRPDVDARASVLETAEAILRYALGGRATFTIVSKATGGRFTYRIRAVRDRNERFFVDLLTGSNNEEDYQYLGTLTSGGQVYMHGRKSRIGPGAPGEAAFAWFWSNLQNRRFGRADGSAVEFWHSGRCGRCNRTLTTPESCSSGIGPECARKL